MTKHVITTLRNLLESDEALRRLIRGGLLNKLDRNSGDPKVWERVVGVLARHDAYLTIKPHQQLWSKSHSYYIKSIRYINLPNNKSMISHWRINYSAIGNPSLQGLSWPFDYLARLPDADGNSGKGPLRDFTFDYVMKSDV
jgi:hypothetical protein